MMENL